MHGKLVDVERKSITVGWKVIMLSLLLLLQTPIVSFAHPVEGWPGHARGIVDQDGRHPQWEELTTTEQEAAKKLGYDLNSWNSDGIVKVDRLKWKELSEVS